MSLSDSGEAGILDLLFLNSNFANIGDATGLRGSTVAGSFYISLHTSDPGEAGNQTTNEAAYTSYGRVAVARSGSGWTRSSNVISNVAAISFPKATGGSETETYFGVGTASSGAGVLIGSGALSPTVAVVSGVIPTFEIGALTVTAT